jgi:hypothetical protein
MEIINNTVPQSVPDEARKFVFFKIKYNHFRDVSGSYEHAVSDREEWAECECVLALPDSYTEDGEETPLIISFHGAGSRVCEAENMVGGVKYVKECVDAGFAALDVCGSELHGLTMGCPEHMMAAYKAYRYAIKHFNLSERVLVAGASMGGHSAMNFANMFPGIVTAIGMFYPRLNMDGVTVDGHYCIGTWDKMQVGKDGLTTPQRIAKVYRFPDEEWHGENVIGFNPFFTRSYVGADGKRVIIPPCPIKVWQGTADTVVDPVTVREFVESVRRSGSYIEAHFIDGVGHKMNDVMRCELAMWFDRFI